MELNTSRGDRQTRFACDVNKEPPALLVLDKLGFPVKVPVVFNKAQKFRPFLEFHQTGEHGFDIQQHIGFSSLATRWKAKEEPDRFDTAAEKVKHRAHLHFRGYTTLREHAPLSNKGAGARLGPRCCGNWC